MVNKHMKRWSASLAIREVQIKPTVRDHYTTLRMSKGKNSDSTTPYIVEYVEKLDHLPIAHMNV